MRHYHKVKGEQVITLQVARHLKPKIINAITGQLFCRQHKSNFFERQRLITLMMKIKFNLLKILPMNLLNVKHQGKNLT